MSKTDNLISLHLSTNIAVISIERPEKAHAYTRLMLERLHCHIQDIREQASVVVVQSAGHRVFCAGADLNEMKSVDPYSALNLLSQKVFQELAAAPFVSIAAVHGPAIAGGCELALACDLRVAGPDAEFSLPETTLGLIPSAGGCTRLPKLIGPSRAKAMILGQDVIKASRALDWGLVNAVENTPRKAAHDWAKNIAESDPVALRLAKQVIDSPSLGYERVNEALLYFRKKQD